MIRVNLAKKQGKGGAAQLDLKNLKLSTLLDMLKARGGEGGEEGKPKLLDPNNPVFRAALAIFACWYFSGYLDDQKAGELKKLDSDVSKYEKEKDAVAMKLAKIKGWEPVKKQLEDDEKAIRLKLEVVKKLLEDRDAPAKMLMQITQTIPDQVWLTNLEVLEDSVAFKGQTPSYNDVSDFIKGLNGTSQFTDIALSGITEQNAGNGQKVVQDFDLFAKRRKGP